MLMDLTADILAANQGVSTTIIGWQGAQGDPLSRYYLVETTTVRVIWSQSPTAEQIAAIQSLVSAFDPSPAAAAQRELLKLRAEAKAYLASSKDAQAKKDRAELAILLDELNDLRAWVTSFKAATAAATNLADFKTRVAALANTPARTMAQAKTKYENMIDSGKQDSGMAD